ncbi:hypothetical protein PSPO01_13184 [Paraphaeosphaeria sporulosa]
MEVKRTMSEEPMAATSVMVESDRRPVIHVGPPSAVNMRVAIFNATVATCTLAPLTIAKPYLAERNSVVLTIDSNTIGKTIPK